MVSHRSLCENHLDCYLVCEGTEASDVVVEWNVDLHGLGDQILNILELVKLVLAHNILSVGNDHAGHESSERSNAVSLTNTQNRGIDVGSSSLQSAVRVCNGTTGIIVEMRLDVTADNTSQSSDEIVDLSWRCTANCVRNTDSVYTDLVNCGVNGEEIDEVRSEGVFGGESDFDVVRLDIVDNFDCGVCDIGHILAVGMLHQIGRRANYDVTEAISKISRDTEAETYTPSTPV
jgi:hypothetical protein